MKTQITIDVDIDQITSELMEQEGSAGYSSIKYAVQQEIKRQAVEQIKTEVLTKAEIGKLVRCDYGEKYLKDLAQNTISAELREKTEAYIKNWINKNMQWVIEDCLRKTLDALIVPRLQKMITNMLIVDTESMDEQMEEMEQALQDEAKGAYEAGQIAAAEEIRKNI